MTIARKQLDKHADATTDMHPTIEEPLKAVFCMQSVPRLYSEDQGEKLVGHES
jgi:hypothetical protein